MEDAKKLAEDPKGYFWLSSRSEKLPYDGIVTRLSAEQVSPAKAISVVPTANDEPLPRFASSGFDSRVSLNDSDTVLVSLLPANVEVKDIRRVFTQYGDIVSCKLSKSDASVLGSLHATIRFANIKQAQLAQHCADKRVFDQKCMIRVEVLPVPKDDDVTEQFEESYELDVTPSPKKYDQYSHVRSSAYGTNLGLINSIRSKKASLGADEEFQNTRRSSKGMCVQCGDKDGTLCIADRLKHSVAHSNYGVTTPKKVDGRWVNTASAPIGNIESNFSISPSSPDLSEVRGNMNNEMGLAMTVSHLRNVAACTRSMLVPSSEILSSVWDKYDRKKKGTLGHAQALHIASDLCELLRLDFPAEFDRQLASTSNMAHDPEQIKLIAEEKAKALSDISKKQAHIQTDWASKAAWNAYERVRRQLDTQGDGSNIVSKADFIAQAPKLWMNECAQM